MSFADWKKRSAIYKAYRDRAIRYGIGYDSVVCAAYKAGERDGIKRTEAISKKAIALRELLKNPPTGASE